MPNNRDLLNIDEFEIVSYEENTKTKNFLFHVKPKEVNMICPNCGSIDVVNNESYNRFVRDLNYCEHKVGIDIMGNLHKCNDCNITFTDIFNSIEMNAKITLAVLNIPNDLKNKVNIILNKIDASIVHIKNENKELDSLRDFLLPMLMNGQVGFKGEK